MDKRDVPWADGRRALALIDGEWVEVVGDTEDSGNLWCNAWRSVSCDAWVPHGGGSRTAFIPNQCPVCFKVNGHADGCRVAVNLAAGVPEFWAQWAHFEDPAQTVATVYQLSGCDLVRMHDAANLGSKPEWVVDCGCCESAPAVDGRPWIAIGLGGAPTNEPWEEE